jgi:hypothetical protein
VPRPACHGHRAALGQRDLGEVAAIVDYGILAVVRSEDADVGVMRDLTESLLPLEGPVAFIDVRRLRGAWRPCTATRNVVTSRACVRPRLAIARTPSRFRPATPGPTPIRIGS